MKRDKIIQAIKDYDQIIIHRHLRPDPDALGSQAGLKEIIQQSFPDKQVSIVGIDDPAFTFLVEMDSVHEADYQGALVIVCDTANTDRIDDKRYTLGDQVIKIDHHPNVDEYGDIQWVDTTASSTSEMIYELYLHGKEKGLRMNPEAARLLYAGIVGDTGRFLFPSTTRKTFQYATDLVAYDFDRQDLYTNLYSIKQNVAKLRGYILQNFKQTESGVSAVKLTKDILNEYDVDPLETGQLVGVFGDISGIKAWVMFVEEEEAIRVRIRSKGPVINEIAAKYGGGGHPLAAGASIYDWADASRLVEDLEEACATYSAKK